MPPALVGPDKDKMQLFIHMCKTVRRGHLLPAVPVCRCGVVPLQPSPSLDVEMTPKQKALFNPNTEEFREGNLLREAHAYGGAQKLVARRLAITGHVTSHSEVLNDPERLRRMKMVQDLAVCREETAHIRTLQAERKRARKEKEAEGKREKKRQRADKVQSDQEESFSFAESALGGVWIDGGLLMNRTKKELQALLWKYHEMWVVLSGKRRQELQDYLQQLNEEKPLPPPPTPSVGHSIMVEWHEAAATARAEDNPTSEDAAADTLQWWRATVLSWSKQKGEFCVRFVKDGTEAWYPLDESTFGKLEGWRPV